MNYCKIILSCLLLVLTSCQKSKGEKQIEWRFALEEIQGSVQDAYAQEFKRIIEKKSDGKIKVTIYPYGTLGTSDQITELVATGAIQFAMASPGYLGKMMPELEVFNLHYLFSEDSSINKKVLSDGETANNLISDLYHEKGFRLLSLYPEGWQVWTTNVPVREPSDFAGVKMRVMTSPVLLKTYDAYGATPVPLPYSEVYSALQLKMIDGQVNPIFAIEEMSFYEVTEYMIWPMAGLFVTSAITSDLFYDRLTDQQKEWVSSTIDELDDFIYKQQKALNDKRLEHIRESKPGMKFIKLTDEQKQVFKKRSMEARKKLLELGGPRAKKVLDGLVKEIKDEGGYEN